MNETRRMHFVPRTYLKHFAIDRGGQYYMYALPKDGTKRIFEININNICVEKDIYSLDGLKGIDPQFVEDMYNVLYESGYDKLYAKLIDPNQLTLTMADRFSIIGFVVSMFYRNNYWNNSFNRFMDEVYEKAYFMTTYHGQDAFYFGDEKISILGKSVEQLRAEKKKEDNPMIALSLAQSVLRLTRLRRVSDVITIVTIKDGSEFITSDNPVIFTHSEYKHEAIPFDPTNTLSIPIDATHLLMLNPWGEKEGIDKHVIGRISGGKLPVIHSSMNNQYQNARAGRFLLGSKTGLEKFEANPLGIFKGRV